MKDTRKISELPDAPYKKVAIEAQSIGAKITGHVLTDATTITMFGAIEMIRILQEEVDSLKEAINKQ